jgi:hypothetical protein
MSKSFEGPVDPFQLVTEGVESAADALYTDTPTRRIKEVVLGVTGALEYAMVCALGAESLRRKDPTKTLHFDDLLSRCQQPEWMQFGDPIDQSEVPALKHLYKEFRSPLAHAYPQPMNTARRVRWP